MSYTVTITEVQQGVTVTANTDLVTVTENSQPITVLVNAVEFATGVTNAVVDGSGNLIITLSNSYQIDAGQVVTSSAYGNTTVAAYLPIYSGSIGAAQEIITLTANAGAQSNQIAGANAAIITANTAMKAYVDAINTSLVANAAVQTSEIAAANAAIVTANTAMKAYTDAQITTTQSWVTGANAAIVTANTAMKNYVDAANSTQSTQINTTQSWVTGANAAIVTANTAMKAYVDANAATQAGQIATTQSWVTGANAAIVTANTAMKSYVDAQDSATTTAWTANAGVQADAIAGANAAIVTANTALKNYVDGQITTTQSWVTGANAAIVTANTALKGYVDAQFTALTNGAPAILDTLGEIATSLGNNASLSTTLLNAIAGSNAAIVTANTALKSYVDDQITTTQGQITTANTALKSYVDAQDSATTSAWTANAGVQADAITALQSNAGAQANQITGANVNIARIDANLGSFQTYANATYLYSNSNVASYLPVYGGNIAANAVTRNGHAWQFNTDGSESFPTATAVTAAAGKMWYNNTTGAWNLGMGGGNITQQIGEEMFVYGKASATITDTPLELVYQTGVVGASGVVTFAPAVAGITDPNLILGCATESIALNATGRITSYGVIHGITTNGTAYGETWADNDDIYYNPVTGGLTKTIPTAPNIKLYIGTVLTAGSGGSGSFFVNMGSAVGLNLLSDVQTASNTGGQVLSYSSADSYWKNTSLTAGTGIDITTYTNGNIAIAGTYSNTNVTAYLSDSVSVGNIASANGYFWANGTAYSTGSGGGTYGNTDVAAYLPGYNGSIGSPGNVMANITMGGTLTLQANIPSSTTTITTSGVTTTAVTATGTGTFGNVISTDGYFWANGVSYAATTAFTGNLVNNSLSASGTGRILANASPQANVQQISTYTQGILVTATPSYTAGNLASANQTVIAAFNGNVNFATSFAAGTRSTSGLLGYLGVTATSANTIMNASDRIRGMQGGLDLNLNGKQWGLLTSASNTLTPILVNGQTLNVYGTGSMGQVAAIGAAVTITPVGGSISAQYSTGMFAGLTYSTAGTTYTASNVQYARLFTGAISGAANLTVANAIALHTYTNWATGNVTLVPNAYAILNEDTRTVIQTAGNININGNGASTGFIRFAVFTVAQLTAVTGSAGQQAAVSNGTGKNSGAMAYWDVTNTRWSWVSDDTAVT